MSYFNKKRFTMRQVVGLLTVVFLGISVIAYATTVDFTSGTTISSTEVENAINQNKSVILCSSESNSISLLSGSVSNINSVTITVPGPGAVLVSGSGTLRVYSDGSSWQAAVSISDSNLGFDYDASNYWGAWQGGFTSGTNYDSIFHEQRSFIVPAAGTYPYYLTGRLLVSPSGTGSVYAGKSRICAVFAPN